MIYTLFMVILVLFVGGALTYFLSVPVDGLIQIMEGTFPAIFTGAQWTMFKALETYALFFLVVFPLLIWVYVNNQKPQGGL